MARYSSAERQRAEEARHRREIIEAAIRVFADRGFHAATIRDVAKAAAFSVGKLYLHFPSKEALYGELLDHYMDRLIDELEDVFAEPGSGRERFERGLRASLAFHERNPMLIGLFASETLGFELRLESQLGKQFTAKFERVLAYFRRAFAKGIEAGEFRGGTADELTIKFAGLFDAVLTREVRRPKRRAADEIAGVILRLFYEPSLAIASRKGRAALRIRAHGKGRGL